jgi:hypothetical protein
MPTPSGYQSRPFAGVIARLADKEVEPMRQGLALLLGLSVCFVIGCITEPIDMARSWWNRGGAFHGPTGPDVIRIDMALLERSPRDPALNQELWSVADEQILPLEQKALLTDNGFRVGLIAGITPAGLQSLLTSERSCVNPRRLLLHAGKTTSLLLGPKTPQCSFVLERVGRLGEINLVDAECTLQLVPDFTKEGSIRLRFTPQIKHGAVVSSPWKVNDHAGWVLDTEQPSSSYPELSWEIMLAPNQYALIGAGLERPQSLGYQCFVRPTEPVPAQRLLVLRASPASLAAVPDHFLDSLDDEAALPHSVPLALQAGGVSVRRQGTP